MYTGTYDATFTVDSHGHCAGSSGTSCGLTVLEVIPFPTVVHATLAASTTGVTPSIEVRDVSCNDPTYCANGRFLGYQSGLAAPYEQKGTTYTFADLSSTPKLFLTMSAAASTWMWQDETLSGAAKWMPVTGLQGEFYSGSFTAKRR